MRFYTLAPINNVKLGDMIVAKNDQDRISHYLYIEIEDTACLSGCDDRGLLCLENNQFYMFFAYDCSSWADMLIGFNETVVQIIKNEDLVITTEDKMP